jgi:hypothetical protein
MTEKNRAQLYGAIHGRKKDLDVKSLKNAFCRVFLSQDGLDIMNCLFASPAPRFPPFSTGVLEYDAGRNAVLRQILTFLEDDDGR